MPSLRPPRARQPGRSVFLFLPVVAACTSTLSFQSPLGVSVTLDDRHRSGGRETFAASDTAADSCSPCGSGRAAFSRPLPPSVLAAVSQLAAAHEARVHEVSWHPAAPGELGTAVSDGELAQYRAARRPVSSAGASSEETSAQADHLPPDAAESSDDGRRPAEPERVESTVMTAEVNATPGLLQWTDATGHCEGSAPDWPNAATGWCDRDPKRPGDDGPAWTARTGAVMLTDAESPGPPARPDDTPRATAEPKSRTGSRSASPGYILLAAQAAESTGFGTPTRALGQFASTTGFVMRTRAGLSVAAAPADRANDTLVPQSVAEEPRDRISPASIASMHEEAAPPPVVRAAQAAPPADAAQAVAQTAVAQAAVSQAAVSQVAVAQTAIAPVVPREIQSGAVSGSARSRPVVAESAPDATDSPRLILERQFESIKRVIRFVFNRAALGPAARSEIHRLLPDARRADRVTLTGHADGIGTARGNHQVAAARASAVRVELVRGGVDAGRIAVQEPVVRGAAVQADRAAARSVDVELRVPTRTIATEKPGAAHG